MNSNISCIQHSRLDTYLNTSVGTLSHGSLCITVVHRERIVICTCAAAQINNCRPYHVVQLACLFYVPFPFITDTSTAQILFLFAVNTLSVAVRRNSHCVAIFHFCSLYLLLFLFFLYFFFSLFFVPTIRSKNKHL